MYNWKKYYAIKKFYDERIGKDIPETAGIYIWTRVDPEINKTYYYIGQAKNLRKRRFDYYRIQTGLDYPKRHFEASLKKHKDWKYQILAQCEESQLNDLEKEYIKSYMAKDNYITRNDSLTGNDTTKSNYNRIERIQKRFDKQVSKIMKHLKINKTNNNYIIVISPERKINGEPTKLGLECLESLKKLLEEKDEKETKEN